MDNRRIIILFGPTGVGKTDFALAVAEEFGLEIVNCDMGQLYTPFSIGTAKPDWKNEKIPHHLFDVVDIPRDYTVVEYRQAALAACEAIWKRGKTPLLVGGSGFYIKSLFFPPQAPEENFEEKVRIESSLTTEELWQQLVASNPERASALHPHDRYRIERALQVGKDAHTLKPSYQQPDFSYLIICLSRDRASLYKRINERTQLMLEGGWIEEVKGLQNTEWASFLKRKKLIGYNDILSFLEESQEYEKLVQVIQQKTRHYAKRQMTFWRMLEKELGAHCAPSCTICHLVINDTDDTLSKGKKIISTFLAHKEG